MDINYIFIEVPKTGSSTIRTHGIGFDPQKIDNSKLKYPVSSKKRHLTACELKLQLSYWNKVPSLAFIRNPWDRIVSEFKWRVKIYKYESNFEKFVNDICDRKVNHRKIKDGQRHLLPQLDFISDENGKIIVSNVLKFENLNQQFNEFRTSLDLAPKKLISINKTKHEHYSKYYNETTKNLIGNYYKQDVIFGNYDFKEIT